MCAAWAAARVVAAVTVAVATVACLIFTWNVLDGTPSRPEDSVQALYIAGAGTALVVFLVRRRPLGLLVAVSTLGGFVSLFARNTSDPSLWRAGLVYTCVVSAGCVVACGVHAAASRRRSSPWEHQYLLESAYGYS